MLEQKTYLVTGGAGFIGSHLAEALLAQGNRVLAIDDLSTGSLDNIDHLLSHPDFCFTRANIKDEVVLDRLALEANVIIHLAAAVGVNLILKYPLHTIQTNIMGTEAVLKAALRYRTKVLVASTSEVYGKSNSLPFREDDDVILGPTSRCRWAYAASKMVDEFMALAYYQEQGLPIIVARLFNIVGPRQTGRYGMVIPRFVQQALRGEPLTVYGDGQQTRCFLHVEDAVRAFVVLSEAPEAIGEVFNVGATEEISILELAKKVIAMVEASKGLTTSAVNGHKDPRVIFVTYDKAYGYGFEDMQKRVPDNSKIRDYLDWEPRKNLNKILQDVIDYYANKVVD
ncbi:MAG: NAD-dependent epimerase/dehydratase family protein [Oscillatoria sp. SIO1A7]|nr:NAD-dependent epimerase/dehydratase family protein [Oscillatoria sp. SIO1A7]